MRLKIIHKLILGTLFINMLAALSVGTAGYFIFKVRNTYDELLVSHTEILKSSKEIQTYAVDQNNNLRGFLLSKQIHNWKNVEFANAELHDQIKKITPRIKEEQITEELLVLDELNQRFLNTARKVADLIETDRDSALMLAESDAVPIAVNIVMKANFISETQEKMLKAAKADIEREVKDMFLTVSVACVVLFVISTAGGVGFSFYISKPILALKREAGLIESGDLSGNDFVVRRGDEMEQLAVSFNGMRRNLRQIIGQIHSDAVLLSETSRVMQDGMGEQRRATDQIVDSIQQVAAGAEGQADTAQEATAGFKKIAGNIEKASDFLKRLSDTSSSTYNMASEGDQAMKNVVVRMQDIHVQMEKMSNIVEKLRDRSQNIEGIVVNIKEIASQIKILSLNALIEASRAGEAGRGFTVVANRVRDLASQSDQMAIHIEQVVETIQAETEQVKQVVDRNSLEYNEGLQMAQSAEILFQEIKLKTGSVASEVVEASETLEAIENHSRDIVRSIDKVAEHTHQAMQETHQVMAATEQQFASMQELVSKATEISEMANGLKSLTRRFKV